MFPAYIVHPQNCQFEGQDPDEKILLFLRAHPITNLPWIILALLLSIAPLFIPLVFNLFNLSLSSIPGPFEMIFLIINYMLVMVILFAGFLYWYFHVYIVT